MSEFLYLAAIVRQISSAQGHFVYNQFFSFGWIISSRTPDFAWMTYSNWQYYNHYNKKYTEFYSIFWTIYY